MRITGAGFVPRGAPVTNLIRHLGRELLELNASLTKPPFCETIGQHIFLVFETLQ